MSRGPFAGRPRLWAVAVAAGILALSWTGFEAVTRSEWLAERARAALAREIGDAAGLAVSIREVRLLDERLSFEVAGLEVRSGTDPGLAPLVAIPEASVKLGWRTILGGGLVIDRLSVRDPVVSLSASESFRPRLHFPEPRSEWPRLIVRQFDVSGGEFVWNGHPLAAEFSGSQLSAQVSLDPGQERYSVEASFSDPQWGDVAAEGRPQGSASISAALGRESVEILDATVRTKAFIISARASLRDPHSPRLECGYSAIVAAGPLAERLGMEQAGLSGALQAEGHIEWDLASDRVVHEGTLNAKAVATLWLDTQAELAAEFAGTRDGLQLTVLDGSVLGGTIEGSLDVRDLWEEPQAAASGTVTGIEVASVGPAVGMGGVPWGGLLDVAVSSTGSRASGLTSDLELAFRAGDAAGDFAFDGSGTARLSSADGRLTIDSLKASSTALRVDLSGTLEATGSVGLDIRADIPSGAALATVLAAVYPGANLPREVPDGTYSFQGHMLSAPDSLSPSTLEGGITVHDFRFGGERWERLEGRGTITAEGLTIRHGALSDGAGRVALSGRIPWSSGGDLELKVSAAGMGAGKLSRASGFGLPIDGALSMELQLSGTRESPQARSTVQVTDPTFFQERFEALDTEILYGPEGFELRQGTLARGDSEVLASAKVTPRSGDFEIDLASNHWPLAEFDAVRELAPGLTGSVRFEVRGSGRVGASQLLGGLQMEGSWDVTGLRRDGVDFGQLRGELRSGRNLESVEFDLSGEVFDGTVEGIAAFWHVEPRRYSGNIGYRDLDVSQLLSALGLPGGAVQATVTGQADFDGDAENRGAFNLNGTVDRAELRLPREGRDPAVITNPLPMRWSLRDGAIQLDSMTMSGPGTEFEVDGAVAVTGARELDLALHATFDLELAGPFAEGIDAAGDVGVALQAGGTLEEPLVEGSIEVAGASLRAPAIPFRLSNLQGQLQLQGSQIRVADLQAESGGGTVRFGGAVVYRDAGLEYRLSAQVDDSRINIPASVSSVIDGEFTLAGAGRRSILEGNVLISRMSMADDLSFAGLFESLAPRLVGQESIPALQEMQVNIHIGAVSHLPVETSLVRDAEADFDLDVVGTLANPSIMGAIGIPKGEIRMLGTHYTISRGGIRFVNPLQTEAVLDVELETRIRDVDIALVLSGPAQSIAVSYRSDPPLPFHELVDLVAIGKEPTRDPSIASQRRIAQQSLVQTGADNLLSQALSRPVSRRLQRFFGVSRLKVDPQIGGLEANPGARISTEQQITDDITLTYSYDLSSAQQQAIRVEWSPSRQWSFIVTRDQNGLVGSDVLYKVRLR